MARPTTPSPPRLNTPDLAPHLTDGTVTAHGEADGMRLAGLRGAVDAAHARIVESEIPAADLDSLELSGASLTDVVVSDIRAITVTARSSRWQTVSVTGGRIATLDLSRAELTGVELRGLRIDYLTLAGATATDVLLADCSIGSLDAPQATLKRVSFEGCRVDEVDDRDWRIEHLDLRGLEAVRYTDLAALRGATMSERQVTSMAVDFALAAGVDIRD